MGPLHEVHQNKQFKEKNFALFSSCFHLKDILSFAFLVLRQISRKGPVKVKDCSWQRYINSFRIKRQIFL